MSTWRGFALCLLLGFIAGCEEPKIIVPTAPPGEVLPHPPIDEKDAAQAIGETGQKQVTETAKPKPKAPPVAPALPTAKGEMKTTETGLKYETLKEGTGAQVKTGQTAMVHYTGTLEDGTEFDSSRKKGVPFPVILGTNQVIDGWEQGIPGMTVGERRKLIIPPKLGYGDKSMGAIPPNSTLTFDVELISIR